MALKWLEISGDYECNNRCAGCFSLGGDGRRMSTAEAIDNLRLARADGARWLWLGGGEPTLRKDLFVVAATARRLGYTRIKLQTNGMMLAYPDYVRRCVEAGVSEVNFAIKGATAETHDRLTGTPGCFDLMMKGIDECRARKLSLDGDVLVYKSAMRELPELVRVFSARGIERFNLWMFSATQQQGADLSSEVPRIAELMPLITEALGQGLSQRPDFITSLHTPPCTMSDAAFAATFYAADLDLLVANPGGFRFRLEESPIEGGYYLERCGECRSRPRCNGIRSDYIAVHGDAEFQPILDERRRAVPLLRDVVGGA